MQPLSPQSHQLPACVCPPNTGRDKQNVSTKTESNFFKLSISSPLAKYAGLYQELLRGVGSFQQLGNRLIRVGERAHAFRQFQLVREVGETLAEFPIRHFQAIGHYFLAVASNGSGKGDQHEARRLFELAAASPRYGAKAILSLAAVSANTGDPDAELYYFIESLKASQAVSTTVVAHRGIAVHKAREGYHRYALRDLENITSLVKHASAPAYFDYLNSYAVELGTVGRLTEACGVIKVVLASPLSPFYPEWQETLSDLRLKHKPRSTVAISRQQIEQKLKVGSQQNELHKARVQTVIHFMTVNLHRKIVLADLASLVHLSSSHFSHLFKMETGLSPGEFLIRLRMEKARELLITRFESIKEVMVMVGYGNKSNFVRHFKRFFGFPPSEYRKRHHHRSARD